MTLAGYEMSKTHAWFTTGGLIAGAVYGIATGKGIAGILFFSVIGSMAGFGAGTLVERPLKVK